MWARSRLTNGRVSRQDYTCAQYKPETFEMLAYTLTIEKLVTVFGYPSVRPPA